MSSSALRTYKSAKAVGNDGCTLEGVVITLTADADKKEKPEPIAIKTIAVEELDFDSIEKNQPPLSAKLRIEGIAASNNAKERRVGDGSRARPPRDPPAGCPPPARCS